ncbi:YggS family pyridoxal phosphate-dependent enzyme [Treponema sp.]|uniref:YggS family pyridoxal phosphate-dependent enzyme n=1 Tax=Treponema sp. TaxID=166 RepID=UPI0025D278B9|nr:YggS family pyridoxal phosphate-dependent enzyme [Treponema sp.]MCR5218431.1 YggS family pyridoxal phosphate-dependent enzyme [Treponema sp.]
MSPEEIKENLEKIKSSLPETVKLCAVSKFHPLENVEAALSAGQTLFGENRVQEAVEKFSKINENSKRAELHIIGSLQSNKVRKAVSVADCIQSADRSELVELINREAARINKNISIFFELHTGEESKSGFASEKEVLDLCQRFADGEFTNVSPAGLMTMAPFTDNQAEIRNSFSTLRKLKEKINSLYPQLPVKELSMGMSGDYKIAVDEGSTMVRVGTAIFGQRNYN